MGVTKVNDENKAVYLVATLGVTLFFSIVNNSKRQVNFAAFGCGVQFLEKS